MLDSSDRVPLLLNGGLGKISSIYWVAVLALIGAINLLGFNEHINLAKMSPTLRVTLALTL
jgi:hypothetical protein